MDYHTDVDGVNLIQQWYETQDPAVQVQFDFVLQEILGTPDLTDSEQFKPLTRKHAGLWEVVLEVIKERKRQKFRPVGFWNYGQDDFILVNACRKIRGDTRLFDSVLDILGEYFREGKGTIHEHQF